MLIAQSEYLVRWCRCDCWVVVKLSPHDVDVVVIVVVGRLYLARQECKVRQPLWTNATV